MSRPDEAENKKRRQAEKEDFLFVAKDARGRRFLRRILEQTKLFQSTFAGESTHTAAFQEGARNVGLFIHSEIIDTCPEQLIAIMKGD